MTGVDIRGSQLYELCQSAIAGMHMLAIKPKSSPSGFEAHGMIDRLANVLKYVPKSRPDRTAVEEAKDNSAIAFSLFAAWFIVLLAKHLGSSFELRTELNKNSPHASGFQELVRGYAAQGEIELIPQEFLVDYYISLRGKLHCPVLTAESESREDGGFHDLSKLLLVNSPRRVYIANVRKGSLADALEKIKAILDQVTASGVVHTSDQIVLVLYKKTGDSVDLDVYDYDQYRHV
jgi:hypothetical protein